MPTPTKTSKKADPEAQPKSNPYSGQKKPRLRIPAGICNDRRTVHQPRVVLGHIDHFGIGWFNDDAVSLSRHLLLFIAIQVPGVVSLLPQCLDGVRHILLLVGICVAKRGSPREVLVHVFEDRWKLRQSLNAGVPRLFVDFFCQLLPLEVGMTLYPAV